ncbi:MAG: T9SS type A sorting domain-containing protein [Candidatus Azobacteroides sp.]|nr:T9SS type A sorting domain-containing protein [Candidatus Azobacteroides sp.]
MKNLIRKWNSFYSPHFYLFFLSLFLVSVAKGYSQKIEVGEKIYDLKDIEKITFTEEEFIFEFSDKDTYRDSFQPWYFSGITSLKDISSEKKKPIVFPNPVTDFLSLKNPELVRELYIYDIHGTLLWTVKPDTFSYEIDFSGYTEGMYLLKINDQTVKIIKRNE